jgi:hypothetical protein
MAFPDPLQIKNVATTPVDYTRRLPIPNGNRYVSTTSTGTVQQFIDARAIFQKKNKPDADSLNRHIITFGFTRVDDEEKVHTASLALSLTRPVGTDITDGDVEEMFAALSDFLVASSGAHLTRFKRGEV